MRIATGRTGPRNDKIETVSAAGGGALDAPHTVGDALIRSADARPGPPRADNLPQANPARFRFMEPGCFFALSAYDN